MFTLRTKIIIFYVVFCAFISYSTGIVTTIINLVINTLKIVFKICMEIKRSTNIHFRDGNWR